MPICSNQCSPVLVLVSHTEWSAITQQAFIQCTIYNTETINKLSPAGEQPVCLSGLSIFITFCHTIRYDTLHLRAPKSWQIASLMCRTEPNKKVMKKLKTKNRDAQKKRSRRNATIQGFGNNNFTDISQTHSRSDLRKCMTVFNPCELLRRQPGDNFPVRSRARAPVGGTMPTEGESVLLNIWTLFQQQTGSKQKHKNNYSRTNSWTDDRQTATILHWNPR